MSEHTLLDLVALFAQQAALGAGGAAAYASIHYARNRQLGERFDPVQYLATILVGGLIGIALTALSLPVTEPAVLTTLLVYSGLVAVVEAALKALTVRWGFTLHPVETLPDRDGSERPAQAARRAFREAKARQRGQERDTPKQHQGGD